MKELNLEKLWEVCNTLSEKESELSEHNTFVSLLGNSSGYCQQEFDSFLDYYSFKIEDDNIVVFNNDDVAWENFRVGDFSYIPSVLLSFAENELENWIDEEIKRQLQQQEAEKIAEKENIKRQIELLQKKLEN